MPRLVGPDEQLIAYYTFPNLEPAPEHDGGPPTQTDRLRIAAANGDFDQLFGKVALGGVEHQLEIYVPAENGKDTDHEAVLAHVALATSSAVFVDRINIAEPWY